MCDLALTRSLLLQGSGPADPLGHPVLEGGPTCRFPPRIRAMSLEEHETAYRNMHRACIKCRRLVRGAAHPCRACTLPFCSEFW